jgi:hypothetical protein
VKDERPPQLDGPPPLAAAAHGREAADLDTYAARKTLQFMSRFDTIDRDTMDGAVEDLVRGVMRDMIVHLTVPREVPARASEAQQRWAAGS